MRLDRTTYEAWLLDRIEGALTPGQERELDAFLAANPDLAPEGADLPYVEGGSEDLPMKDGLHREFPPIGAPDAARLNDFLVARMEGGLSDEQERQLERYLYEHPEVMRDASLMSLTKLGSEAVAFNGKAGIERHFPPHGLPDEHRLVDFLIAKAEGDLHMDQHDALEHYLREHPAGRRERELVAATFVKSEVLVYPGKNRLKKRALRVLPLWPRLAAAASIALLLTAGWWLLRAGRPAGNTGIAQVGHTVPRGPGEDRQPDQTAPVAPVHGIAPEAPKVQVGNAGRKASKDVAITARGTDPSPKEQPSTERTHRADRPLPVLEPMRQVMRAAIPEQTLAQAAVGEDEWTIAQAPMPTPSATATPVQGENLGTFLANRMRSDVLETPRRADALDRRDALAMADKAIGKITGGQGGVDVQRSATRDRFLLRLGRNFSLSASRGR
jgi:hypothetical protein